MKILAVIFLTLISQFSLADEASDVVSGEILGRWKFVEYIYEGQKLPIPNPELNLYFEFFDTGSDRLWWYRNNEPGFCERFGFYTYESDTLTDQVIWVNPNNHVECSQHPDMKMGQTAKNKVTFQDGQLYLHLSLKGQPFIYVWNKQ